MGRLKRGGWPYSHFPNVPFRVNRRAQHVDDLEMWIPLLGVGAGSDWFLDRVAQRTFTKTGTPVWTQNGWVGLSLLFDDATPDYFEYTPAVLDALPITLMCWAWFDDLTPHQSLVALGGAGNQYHWLLKEQASNGNRIRAQSCAGGSAPIAATSTAATLGTWHHCIAVFTTNERRAYLDGGARGDEGSTLLPALTNTTVGVMHHGAAYIFPMSGFLLDIRMYSYAFNDDDALYQWMNPWELFQPLVRRWSGGMMPPPPPLRVPRHGFTNFQIPGIV